MKKKGRFGYYVAAAFALLVMAPILYMIVGSLLRIQSYKEALLDPVILRMFWNSTALTIPILAGQLIISPLAAYGFEMARFRGKEALFGLYIIVMLMPLQLLMVPHYIAAEALGYNNTWWAIILPGIFAPFGTFLLRQQMKGLDRSIMESARLDGANEWQIFRKIVLPELTPTMAALTVLTFAEGWNIVDQAVVFLRDAMDQPLSVYLSQLVTGDMGTVFAASCIYLFPAFLVFLWGHDHMVHGIALSGGGTGG